MKKLMLVFYLLVRLPVFTMQAQDFSKYPAYKGPDLGLRYASTGSSFRVWSPAATNAELIIYEQATGGSPLSVITMNKAERGTWTAVLPGDLNGKFYVFRVLVNGRWLNEVTDPYVKITGINGTRGFIADLKDSNPEGWEHDKGQPPANAVDAVIYELHVRDASMARNSGIIQKGKFNGLTEKGTKNKDGLPTGLDHLVELGITHVHLLPVFDYNSIDEADADKTRYNWGYDPLNYNVPEGSYSSNPFNGLTRIKELKTMIMTFHENGLNVIMDVVYNHTALTKESNFNQLVPGYYYRQAAGGNGFSNATACGNETASERTMVRKFILESMKYWVQEYHVDGFRVDLMGVHDIETMDLISKELHKINPGILLYGEGWTAGASPLPDSLRALKKNASRLDQIAVFSDDIRDGIKGSVFEQQDRGFVSGKPGLEESIKFGVVAACKHAQVDYQQVNYSKAPWALQPYNTITYCECHDNQTLWDKLSASVKNVSEQGRREMQKLALSIVLTSQGISFLQAGTEFLRSKKGVENSFESPDSINAIDWDLKTKNKDVFDYVKDLIKMRKAHPAFHMKTAHQIASSIRFIPGLPADLIGYTINGAAVNDTWKKICVWFNGSPQKQVVSLPGDWELFAEGNKTAFGKVSGSAVVAPRSCSILYQR